MLTSYILLTILGNRFWVFKDTMLQPSYPQDISLFGSGMPTQCIETAVWWEDVAKTYFFKGDRSVQKEANVLWRPSKGKMSKKNKKQNSCLFPINRCFVIRYNNFALVLKMKSDKRSKLLNSCQLLPISSPFSKHFVCVNVFSDFSVFCTFYWYSS